MALMERIDTVLSLLTRSKGKGNTPLLARAVTGSGPTATLVVETHEDRAYALNHTADLPKSRVTSVDRPDPDLRVGIVVLDNRLVQSLLEEASTVISAQAEALATLQAELDEPTEEVPRPEWKATAEDIRMTVALPERVPTWASVWMVVGPLLGVVVGWAAGAL